MNHEICHYVRTELWIGHIIRFFICPIYQNPLPPLLSLKCKDGTRGGDVWDVKGQTVRLQSGHLVAGGDSDRAGTDRAAQPRDEPNESPAKNSKVWAPHTRSSITMVRVMTHSAMIFHLCQWSQMLLAIEAISFPRAGYFNKKKMFLVL